MTREQLILARLAHQHRPRTDWMPLERYAHVGAALLEAVTPLARRYLLSELRAAADAGVDDRATERRHQDWRDAAAEDAGVPRSGEL